MWIKQFNPCAPFPLFNEATEDADNNDVQTDHENDRNEESEDPEIEDIPAAPQEPDEQITSRILAVSDYHRLDNGAFNGNRTMNVVPCPATPVL